MTESQHLAEALESFLVNDQNGWFLSAKTAMDGLTAEQAAWTPGEKFNSIWQTVLHMAFWQEYALVRLQDLPFDREGPGGPNGWFAISDPKDESAWQTARERLLEGNEALARWSAGQSDEALNRSRGEGQASARQVIQGIVAHNAYHTSEIITLRHLQGLWLEDT